MKINIYIKKIFAFFFKKSLDWRIKKIKKSGLNFIKRDVNIVISLTSYPHRVSILQYTIYSLLNQTIKPDKIILWLEKDKFPRGNADLPNKLLQLREFGLSIKWCSTMRSYCKLIPTLREYPNDVIVTCDDDVYYPPNWLKKLYKEYEKNNKSVICHRAHKIMLDIQGNLMPYSKWIGEIKDGTVSFNNFLTGVGGVLYPPSCLHQDVMKMDLAKKLCPLADDVWFWGMAVLNETKIKSLYDGINKPFYLVAFKEDLNNEALSNQNVFLCKNDEQLEAMLNFYPQILSNLKGE